MATIELTCSTAVRTCSWSSSVEIRLRTMLFFEQYLRTVLSLNPFSPGYICFNMLPISACVFFRRINKSRIKSTSAASMFEFGGSRCNIQDGGHSCQGPTAKSCPRNQGHRTFPSLLFSKPTRPLPYRVSRC